MVTEIIVGDVPKDVGDDILSFRSAAFLALKKARMYGTQIAVMRNGQVVFETPDEFERHLQESKDN